MTEHEKELLPRSVKHIQPLTGNILQQETIKSCNEKSCNEHDNRLLDIRRRLEGILLLVDTLMEWREYDI